MSEFLYKIIRSARKSISLEITPELEVLVRAPLQLSDNLIESFVSEHMKWIEKSISKQRIRQKTKPPEPTADQVKELKKKAKLILPERTEYFARIVGTNYKTVKINSAKKRLGSCSSDNSINFSYRLLLYPPEVIEYVVIHELCHTIEHNHSKRFYCLVKKFCPEYREIEKMIKG